MSSLDSETRSNQVKFISSLLVSPNSGYLTRQTARSIVAAGLELPWFLSHAKLQQEVATAETSEANQPRAGGSIEGEHLMEVAAGDHAHLPDDEYDSFKEAIISGQMDQKGESDSDSDVDFVPHCIAADLKDSLCDKTLPEKRTKVTQREVEDMVEDLLEAYHLDASLIAPAPMMRQAKEEVVPPDQRLSADHLKVLKQQIRQHIQLLTQVSLLCCNEPDLAAVHSACETMLTELASHARDPQSVCAQTNLGPSVELIEAWKRTGKTAVTLHTGNKRRCPELSADLMDFVADSEVFLYPEMLPVFGFCQGNTAPPQVFWSDHENSLIALGLDRFCSLRKTPKKKFISRACVFLAKNNVVKNKTPEQIKCRIKNMRCGKRRETSLDNAITHYLQTGKLAGAALLDTRQPDLNSFSCPPPLREAKNLPKVWRLHYQSVKSEQPEFPASGASTSPFRCFRPIAIKESPGHVPDTCTASAASQGKSCSKSTLTKERERLLKKYSPIKTKMKHRRRILPAFHATAVPTPSSPGSSSPSACCVPADTTSHRVKSEDRGDLAVSEDKCDDDGSAVMSNCALNAQSGCKRKSRLQREAEVTVHLLQDVKPDEQLVLKAQEAMDIASKAKQLLSPESYDRFLDVVVKYAGEPTKAFAELREVCMGHAELQPLLLDILSPADALSVGHDVYYEHCTRSMTKRFFHKVKLLFAHQPATQTRFLKELVSVLSGDSRTHHDIRAMCAKLFKNSSHLHDEFLALIPGMAYPESLLQDPEEIELQEDSDEDLPVLPSCELLDIPETQQEADFGCDNCPCQCHSGSSGPHCIHCSLKFINGHLYSRGDSKTLRMMRITYPNGDSPFQSRHQAFQLNLAGRRKRKKGRERAEGLGSLQQYSNAARDDASLATV